MVAPHSGAGLAPREWPHHAYVRLVRLASSGMLDAARTQVLMDDFRDATHNCGQDALEVQGLNLDR